MRLTSRLFILGYWLAIVVGILVCRNLASSWPQLEDLHFFGWVECAVPALLCGSWLLLRLNPRWAFRRGTFLTAAMLLLLGWQVWLLHSRNLISLSGPHASADLGYLAAVTSHLQTLGNEGQKLNAKRLRVVTDLELGLAEWTSRVAVGQITGRIHRDPPTSDSFRQNTIYLMANDIFPTGGSMRNADATAVQEARLIAHLTDTLPSRLEELSEQDRLASQQLLVASNAAREGVDQSAVLAGLAFELTQIQTEAQFTRKTMARLESRRQLRLQLVREAPHGLNARYPWLRLPVYFPGGWWWAWSKLASLLATAAGLLTSLIPIFENRKSRHQHTDRDDQVKQLGWHWGAAALASFSIWLLQL